MFSWLLDFGATVESGVVPVFELFKDERFAPLVSFLLLSAAVLAALEFFLRHAVWMQRKVRRCTRLIRQIPDDIAFAQRVDQFEEAVSRTPLRHAWSEFKETLIFPDPARSGERLVIRNTARPQDYFSSFAIGLHFRFFRALPNLFVGLGLLLTFIGLVSALYFASQGITSDASVATTQAALQNLLHAATFKFYTSVAGLAGSILLTLTIRSGTNLIDGAFDDFSEALEEKMIRVTPESIAFNQYIEAREQTLHLKRFNDEVAISVGKYIETALNTSLPQHLSHAMEPVAEKLSEVTSNLSRMNEDSLRSMADGFGQTMQGIAGDQIRGLADVISGIKDSLDGMREKMDRGGADLAANVGRSTDAMRDAITAMTGVINEVSAKIEASMSRGGEALDKQLGTAGQVLNDISDKIVASLEAAARSAGERVSVETASIGKILINGAQAASSEAQETIKAAVGGMTDALGGIAEDLKGAITAMTLQLSSATRELREVELAVERQRSAMLGVAEGAKSTESAMTGAAKAIRDASAPLAAVGSTIAQASKNIETSIQGAVSALDASRQQTRAVSEQLRETFETLQRAWSNYETRFNGVDASLERAFRQIMEHVESSVHAMHNFVIQVDGKLSETVERLGGGIEELGEFVQLVDRATVQLKSSVDALGQRPN